MADIEFTTEELETEEWRDVVGYEGVYSVSNLGRIRRNAPAARGRVGMCKPGRIMSQSLNEFGYCRKMRLTKDGMTKQHWPHRIVATAFIGPPPTPSHTVNHRNGIKTDNRPQNLEWATIAENNRHAIQMGLNRPLHSRRKPDWGKGRRNGKYTRPESTPRGSGHSNAKLSEDSVTDIRSKYSQGGTSYSALAAEYGVDKSLISLIVKRKIWTHI